MWIIYSFISALAETTKDIIGKKGSQQTNIFITAFSLNFFALLVLTPILIYSGIPTLKPAFWYGVLAAAFTIPAWSILYMKAIKLSPLSLSVPMLAFNPAFTAILGIFFDKKMPSIQGWIGIILLGVGLYLLRLTKETIKKGIFHPILMIKNEPGSIAMLGVALIWSIGAHVSKVIVTNSSPPMGAFIGTLNAAIILFIIGVVKKQINISTLKNGFKYLIPLGLFDGVSSFAMYLGLSIGITPYVISIKRTNMLWSSLMGKLIFKEQFDKTKLIGILTLLGAIILIITA